MMFFKKIIGVHGNIDVKRNTLLQNIVSKILSHFLRIGLRSFKKMVM